MASWQDFYGTGYLSAKALGKRKIRGKIITVFPETTKGSTKEEKTQLCMEVTGEDAKILLNKTNAAALAAVFGDNFAKWVGRTVEIKTAPTTYAGKAVQGLLVVPIGK
jgi:hypothetical protein